MNNDAFNSLNDVFDHLLNPEGEEKENDKEPEPLQFDFGDGFYSLFRDIVERPSGVWSIRYALKISELMNLIATAEDNQENEEVEARTLELIKLLGSLRRTLFHEPCVPYKGKKIALFDPRAVEFIRLQRIDCHSGLSVEILHACNYLRSKGRKVDFDELNPRYWVSKEDGVTPLW